MLEWSTPNEKLAETGQLLGAKIWSFNLPAFRSETGFTVCPGAASCRSICYAQTGWYRRHVVADLRERNLKELREAGTAEGMHRLLSELFIRLPKSVKFIRLHDSGDFFSKAYLTAWLQLIQEKKLKFYAYTKSVPLVVGAGSLPSNFQVVYSEGGKWDHLIPSGASRSRIFATTEEREAAGYCDGNSSDIPAINGEPKIGLVYHGGLNVGDVDGALRQQPLFPLSLRASS